MIDVKKNIYIEKLYTSICTKPKQYIKKGEEKLDAQEHGYLNKLKAQLHIYRLLKFQDPVLFKNAIHTHKRGNDTLFRIVRHQN
jgi:hypothetical protein